MEVLLKPGKTAFIINVITDALVMATGFGLIRSLNAYGRRKLYKRGKANMNLHFHETTIIPALQNAFLFRKSSRAVVVLFCIQAAVCAISMSLKTVAVIGISQSKNFRVSRNDTLEGEAVCRENGPSYPLAHLGEAMRRLVTHFESGGDILSVGRTGRNSDALLMEDSENSLGRPFIVNEFRKSIMVNTSALPNGAKVGIDVFDVVKENGSSVSEVSHDVEYTFRRLTYPEIGVQVTEGPLYVIYLFHSVRSERYAFVRCDLPTLRLQEGESRITKGECNVSNLERDTTKAGEMKSIAPVPQLLRELEHAYKVVNMSVLGHRWIMVFDLAKALSQEQSCGDSYVAYVPFSEISKTSIVLLCVLGGVAIASLMAAMLLFLHTRNTFNWNGSYERVINLALHSDSIPLESSSDIDSSPDANIVIECANGIETSYEVQIVPRGFASRPVPEANVKLIK